MAIGALDILVFVVFVAAVVILGMVKSRQQKDSESYFLAGRGLMWWLIGFSLIAANISTEQFVGMSGNAASHVGLAIASYEWMAAITLVVVGFAFLPYFLRAGIYTMPEFLEVRYNTWARGIMAVSMILILLLLLGAVTYSGALTITTLALKMGYDVRLWVAALAIGLIAMLYVTAGGLKACAWADLIQGSALVVGGAVILYFAFQKLGLASEAARVVDVKTGEVAFEALKPGTSAFSRFWELNRNRLNMFLPANDPVLPWTALLLGLWIPNFYYWGLNQYITQRLLGSASLKEGQKGIVFAAFLKLLIPFVVVIPGIIAFNLYAKDMRLAGQPDNAIVMAKYVKANPDTQVVEVAQAPTEAAVEAWADEGRYLLAVYPDEKALLSVKSRKPGVLPILKASFDAARVAPHTVFVSEDYAWKHVNAALAAEVEAYNRKAEAAAKSAGAATATVKFIAYKYDTALGQLLGHVLPQQVGLVGFVLAALLGAVVSSLAAMLNAASTIFTMDVYKKLHPAASQDALVSLGRAAVVAFAAVAVILAPMLGNPKISNSIFTIIQESQGLISPGILAVFAFGLVVRRAPRLCGVVGLVTSIVSYATLKFAAPGLQFLNRMAVCFGLCLAIMAVITALRPLPQPVEFKANTTIGLDSSKGALACGLVVIALTLILYLVFSPLVVAK